MRIPQITHAPKLLTCVLASWCFLATGPFFCSAAEFQPLTPGNLLATYRTSSKPLLYELTLDGEVVQQLEIPKPKDAEFAPDMLAVTVEEDGSIHMILKYRPADTNYQVLRLAIWNPVSAEWRFVPIPNQKLSSLAYCSDLVRLKDNLYAVLVNPDEAFVVDVSENPADPAPLPSGECLAVGPDGKYYVSGGWRLGRNDIVVFDADQNEVERITVKNMEPAALAVDEDGSIYAARYATLVKLSPTREETRVSVSKQWSGDAIYDIELLPNGKLAMGSRSGKLFTIDRDLNEATLQVSPEDLAGWVAYIPAPPEPAIEPAPDVTETETEPEPATPVVVTDDPVEEEPHSAEDPYDLTHSGGDAVEIKSPTSVSIGFLAMIGLAVVMFVGLCGVALVVVVVVVWKR